MTTSPARSRTNARSRTGRAEPCSAFRWGVLALILDAAALLHGSIVTWVVLSYNRHWASWDAKFAGADLGDAAVWNDCAPIMIFLALAWTISLAAAVIAWVRILRQPTFVGRRHVG